MAADRKCMSKYSKNNKITLNIDLTSEEERNKTDMVNNSQQPMPKQITDGLKSKSKIIRRH